VAVCSMSSKRSASQPIRPSRDGSSWPSASRCRHSAMVMVAQLADRQHSWSRSERAYSSSLGSGSSSAIRTLLDEREVAGALDAGAPVVAVTHVLGDGDAADHALCRVDADL